MTRKIKKLVRDNSIRGRINGLEVLKQVETFNWIQKLKRDIYQVKSFIFFQVRQFILVLEIIYWKEVK